MVRTGELVGHELLATEVVGDLFSPMFAAVDISSSATSAASFSSVQVIPSTAQATATSTFTNPSAAIKTTQTAASGIASFAALTATVKPSNYAANSGSVVAIPAAKVFASRVNSSAISSVVVNAGAKANASFSSGGLGIAKTEPLLKSIVLVMQFDEMDIIRPPESRGMTKPADSGPMIKSAQGVIVRGAESRALEPA